MIVSLEWLKDYTDIPVDVKTFCDGMILSGSNLETCEAVGRGMTKVVVGKILKIEPHPNADKLVVCQVDVGDEQPLQIVTGATNIFEGAYVPVALHGSHIPGPLHGHAKEEGGAKITRGKLRGVVSDGMLCSFGELGFEDKVIPVNQRDGIWILDGPYPVGKDFAEALELSDYILDFEITPNRPDCLSMIGMAREAAATFGTKLRYPKTGCEQSEGCTSDYISVEVRSPLCKRYTARIIKDVKIADSPWWLQRRLIHAGMRPINNIVDITNFVMLEYGQPLHAFDITSVAGQKIVVDTAYDGEVFTTLDGTQRTLDSSMLMIHDGEKSIGIAGVMGGLNSEILDTTKTIILESANFLGSSIRSTSNKLKLRTEASGRYEKGIDPNLCEAAADRVCALIELIGAGTVVGGSVDVYPNPEPAPVVHGRVSRINKLLGLTLSREEMASYLESLEMTVTGEGDDLYVTAPTVRQDIAIEEDLVEEVARLYGYDRLPTTIPRGNSEAGQTEARDIKDLSRTLLCAMGASEIQTYSFVSPKSVDMAGFGESSRDVRSFVRILNPLGEDTSVMRTVLTPGMLETLGRNYSRSIPAVCAYEIGNTFIASPDGPSALPDERDNLVIGAYGPEEDFFTLKGVVEMLLRKLGLADFRFVPERNLGVCHPGRCARILARRCSEPAPEQVSEQASGEVSEEVELGFLGEVHPQVAERFGIGCRCYIAELSFRTVTALADLHKTYVPLPRYPAVSRDIALLVDEDVPAAEIERVIREAGTEILRDVKLFDIYRGRQVAPGKKSVAFTLTYRNNEQTLTDEEVARIHGRVLAALREKLDAVLRDM